jgi:RecB family endonuclease NucS
MNDFQRTQIVILAAACEAALRGRAYVTASWLSAEAFAIATGKA